MANDLDTSLDDPAEAWALIERFARAAVPSARAGLCEALDRLRATVPGPETFPDGSVGVALAAAMQRAVAALECYQSHCATTQRMMNEHYRLFPRWQGPGNHDG